MPLFSRTGVWEILACGITAFVYVGTLFFGFVYDDVPQILKNPGIQSWHYLPRYFTSHVWATIYPNSAGNYYRPLFLLWLRLNYLLFGASPAGWHATSVLCHTIATWLVFRLARQLTRDRIVAFVAALLFGLHPAHIENVAWISGVTDPLMTCFVLASCTAFVSFRVSRKVAHLVLSVTFFALALLSKETAAITPLLIFALSLISCPAEAESGGIAPKPTRALRETAPFVLLTLIYLGVRLQALGGIAHPTVSISWEQTLLTWPPVLWFYAKHLLLPLHLSEFYALNYVGYANTKQIFWPFLLLLVLGLASHRLIRAIRQKCAAFFALTLIILPLLPVLNLRSLTAGDIVHDRYLYLPSVGFALLVALLIAAGGRRTSDHQRRIGPAALIAIVSLVFAALTLIQQEQWSNDIALYTRGVESAPDNLTVRDNLANALLEANQPDRAIPLYHDVLKRNPNFWRSNYNLGYAYYKTGRAEPAEEYLRRAIAIDGSDSDQYIYLAVAELQLKKLADAADNARQAIARNPQARGYHYVLGLICASQGDEQAALAALNTELREHPENAAAAAELQKIDKSRRFSANSKAAESRPNSQYMPARYLPSSPPLP
jgi:protein O-mannosyl-transferase